MTELRYTYVPPYAGSGVDHVGTYKRTVPVNLERMYENALDWQHLPHLHNSSFEDIECIDAGGWGWRCRSIDAKGRESVLELSLDKSCRRWITRNLEGPSKGAEIWTHVFVSGERSLDLVIDFFIPGVAEEAREKVGLAYASAYEILYDEDVWMMSERQNRLDQRLDTLDTTSTLEIAVPDVTQLPLAVDLSGRSFQLNRLAEEWVIYPSDCPHQLGPLREMDEQGHVTCPWHGYEFDVRSGEASNAACRFGQRPKITESGDQLTLSWA